MVIKNKTISGFAQKGPFKAGSEVKLYELDSTTLMQTGRSYSGEIESDDGKFKIKEVTLASPYVLLKVSGVYQYVTNNSLRSIDSANYTLNVLTDLRDRDNVNINLLSHLEYGRILNLVKDGLDISAAKKQAGEEILKAFDIPGNFASEDLNIFGSSEGDAALLATSILMRRNLWDNEFEELLTDFANDFKKDGKWDSKDADATKAKMADWAAGLDLESIRATIEKLDFVTKAPNFEKYITQFWTTSYGLTSCETATHGDVMENKNPLSETYQANYFCDDDKWRVAHFYELNDLGKGYFLNSDIVYDSIIDARDGQSYKIVTIGKQTWMAENLNYADSVTTTSLEGNSWCFGRKSTNCDLAGRFYSWAAAIDSVSLANDETNPQECGNGKTCNIPEKWRGICPTDWHLPTDEEWETLLTTAGPSNAGKNLKSQHGWQQSGWASTDHYGTDKYGFSAIPTATYGSIVDEDDAAYFWSVTQSEEGTVHIMELWSNNNEAELKDNYKDKAYSIRCIKD